jgi:hypothetical protein
MPVKATLCLDRNARFGVRLRRTRHFVYTLRPFIAAVSGGIAEHGQLTTAVRRAAESHPDLAQAFALDNLEEAFGLRWEHLFPLSEEIDRATFINLDPYAALDCEGHSTADFALIGRLVELCARGTHTEREVRARFDDELIDTLLALGCLEVSAPAPRLTLPRAPGIVRLQHGSLLYRGDTTGILVDPLLHAGNQPRDLSWTFSARDLEGLVDAILITQGHPDRFSLSTLMMFPRDLPIVVPHVPRLNLLCDDLAARLTSLGFTRVLHPAWNSSALSLGDFEIHPLPFYGDQPLSDQSPRHPDLRNWGNTYLLKTRHYTSWLLSDAGNDVAGTTAAVARDLASRLGPVDFLVGHLRRLQVGNGVGSPWYIFNPGVDWLALTARQVAAFPSLRGDLTLGPDGVAEIATICRARTFLPYANGWTLPGTSPEEAGLSDAGSLAQFRSRVNQLGGDTELRHWAIGDGYFCRGKREPQRRRCWQAEG